MPLWRRARHSSSFCAGELLELLPRERACQRFLIGRFWGVYGDFLVCFVAREGIYSFGRIFRLAVDGCDSKWMSRLWFE